MFVVRATMRKSIAFALLTSANGLTQEPTFKTGTNLVEIDVVVRDKKGPVEGLTKNDFTVLDNGKRQQISVFTVRSLKGGETSNRKIDTVAADAVSNRANDSHDAPGTSTVVLIDQKSTPQSDQAYAIQRVAKFIGRRRRNDRIGVYAFGSDGVLRVIKELSGNDELLGNAIKGFKAQDPSVRTLDIY